MPSDLLMAGRQPVRITRAGRTKCWIHDLALLLMFPVRILGFYEEPCITERIPRIIEITKLPVIGRWQSFAFDPVFRDDQDKGIRYLANLETVVPY
jgi:hypothetical protein